MSRSGQQKLIVGAPKDSISQGWQPAFLKREELLAVWDNNCITSEIQHVPAVPKDDWFRAHNPIQIIVAKAYFSEDGVLTFNYGRHRTRWMLQQGYENIPVCLKLDSYVNALFYGLLSHIAFDGDVVK